MPESNAIHLEVALLKADVSGLKGDISTLADAFEDFSKEFQRNRQWNWGIIGPLATIGTVVTGALIAVIQLQISPVASDLRVIQRDMALQQAQFASTGSWARDVDKQLQLNEARDTGSEGDRRELNRRVEKLEDKAAANAERSSVLAARLCEIETQFAADESSSITRDQYVQRWLGVFYQRLFGVPMPSLGQAPPGPGQGKACLVQ